MNSHRNNLDRHHLHLHNDEPSANNFKGVCFLKPDFADNTKLNIVAILRK